MSVSDFRRVSLLKLRGGPKPGPGIWAAYGALGLLLLAYLVMLVHQPARAHSTLISGVMDAFELACGFLCMAAGRRRPTARAAVPVILGAILMWTLGDIALTIESIGGAAAPVPSAADVFYLAFFPLAYVALVLMMRGEARRLVPATWLDGAVAGLGAAALLRRLRVPRPPPRRRRRSAVGRVNLAYPVGDVLLVLLVVGGTP